MRSFSCRIADVFFTKEVFDHLWLLLSTVQMTAHGGDHLRLVPRAALAQGIGLHILVEQLVRVQLRAIPGHHNQPQPLVVLRDKLCGLAGSVYWMAIYDQIHLVSTSSGKIKYFQSSKYA